MKNIYQNAVYRVRESHHCDAEFKYAIVTNVGSHISDCQIINLDGQNKPGLEFSVPINNSQLEELSYRELNSIRPFESETEHPF